MSASTANRFSRVTRSPFKARVVKRVLIVNAFFDDRRLYMPYPRKVPQAMAPFYLAGAFSRKQCEVRVFNEHHSGPLQDAALLGWPDMLVLTGLTTRRSGANHQCLSRCAARSTSERSVHYLHSVQIQLVDVTSAHIGVVVKQ